MKDSIFVPIIDNGMGLSRTSWAFSMVALCMNHIMRDRHVMIQAISYSSPAAAMNIATYDFMESGCETMLTIDTDVKFTPHHVEHLLSHGLPFVAGLYPIGRPGLTFPMEFIEGREGWGDDPETNPLLEVKRVAKGFTAIRRKVFETISPHVQTYFDPQAKREQKLFWNNLLGGHSEDFCFCDLYRSIGGSVWVDQRICTQHDKSCIYPIEGTFAK